MKRLFFKGKRSTNQVKVLGRFWAHYGSLSLIFIYLLVLINSYDIFVIFSVMLVVLAARLVGFKNLKLDQDNWVRKRKSIVIDVIKKIELGNSLLKLTNQRKLNRQIRRKRVSFRTEFLAAFLVSIIAILVRFYLARFDNYQLSPFWFQELNILNELNEQRWFGSDLSVKGGYAFMSVYALLTGISTELALESFAYFQIFLVCFMIFWFIDELTTSLVTIPLITSLLFALFFNFAPINLTQLTHSSSSLMALTFLMPVFVYTLRPWKLYKKKSKNYFLSMAVIFIAIALISLFALLILLPIFFIVAFPFARNIYRKYLGQAILAYLTSTAVVMHAYAFTAYLKKGVGFWSLIKTNLLSVSTTTVNSNMVWTYSDTILYFQIITLVSVCIMLFLFFRNSRKWSAPVVYLLYVNVLILISKLGIVYLDLDLFNEYLGFFMVTSLGFIAYLIYYFFTTTVRFIRIPDAVSIPLVVIVLVSLSYISQKSLFQRESREATLSKTILEAYELVETNHIPYGYAVVNDNNMLPISQGSHNFISYEDFIETYPERDSIYFEFKDDEDFLRENTQYIIPNSLIVFIYSDYSSEFSDKLSLTPGIIEQVRFQMDYFRSKGREVRMIYTAENLEVYEIINRPNLTRLNEML